jgi:hypothetical protein
MIVISNDQFRGTTGDTAGDAEIYDGTPDGLWNERVKAGKWLLQVLSDDTPACLLIMIGIPGSGKTTWCQQNQQDVGDVAYDSTNLTRLQRLPWILFGHHLGWRVKAVLLDTPLEVCLMRSVVGRRPVRVIVDHWQRLEKPDPSEGWDEIITVSGTPNLPQTYLHPDGSIRVPRHLQERLGLPDGGGVVFVEKGGRVQLLTNGQLLDEIFGKELEKSQEVWD